MAYAPVIVFAYNRPKHLETTLNCLNASPIASKCELFILCDGPKQDKSDDLVTAAQGVARSFSKSSCFKRVEVIASSSNNGLANSVIAGVTALIEHFGSAIVVEDDLATSPFFLEYMNEALLRYRDDERIWSISGYTPPLQDLDDRGADVYFAQRGCSWGWGTWFDRWLMVDWLVSSYDSFKNNVWERLRFGKCGRDMPTMLDMQMAGCIDSWAIRWCYEEFRRDMYTVYPTKSLVKNIGMDGSGTHSGITDSFNVVLDSRAESDFQFDDFVLDKELMKSFRAQYSGSLYGTCKAEIKWALIRSGFRAAH